MFSFAPDFSFSTTALSISIAALLAFVAKVRLSMKSDFLTKKGNKLQSNFTGRDVSVRGGQVKLRSDLL